MSIPPNSPKLLLAFRDKTGCKQYAFASEDALEMFFSKKCYRGEVVKVHEYAEGLFVRRWTFDAGVVLLPGVPRENGEHYGF